jgi:hypothetical protein
VDRVVELDVVLLQVGFHPEKKGKELGDQRMFPLKTRRLQIPRIAAIATRRAVERKEAPMDENVFEHASLSRQFLVTKLAFVPNRGVVHLDMAQQSGFGQIPFATPFHGANELLLSRVGDQVTLQVSHFDETSIAHLTNDWPQRFKVETEQVLLQRGEQKFFGTTFVAFELFDDAVAMGVRFVTVQLVLGFVIGRALIAVEGSKVKAIRKIIRFYGFSKHLLRLLRHHVGFILRNVAKPSPALFTNVCVVQIARPMLDPLVMH